MRPYEIGEDGLFVRLSAGARPTSVVVAAPRRTVAFDTPERVKVMNNLVIHLQQALRTQSKLAALNDSTRELLAAVDAIPHGVIIVGADCAVVTLNSAAEQYLRANDGLHTQSGRIAAISPLVERQLSRALHFALAGGQSGIRGGQRFTCPRPSGMRPYVIHVMPIHRRAADERPGNPSALVLIVDPERETESAATLLRRLYGLTQGEAEVALRLGDGASLKQIADETSVSYETVRTHLQHVFEKTDTHRQAEVVRLLLTLGP
jgi:DNA-binding CsgD family transcriptional regulator